MKLTRARAIIILLTVGLFLFTFKLGERSLWDSDETRTAEIAREMMERGDYLIPHLNGQPLPTKPPLYHWLIVLFSSIPGEVTAITARLPAALLGIGGLIITFLLGERLLGRTAGFMGALILATSNEYWWLSRFARVDMSLTFFFTLALFALYIFLKEGKLSHLILWYICLGLATVAKGPVGVALPVITLLAYLAVTRGLGKIKEFRPALGLGVLTVVILPWYLTAYFKAGPDYLRYMIIGESATRFLGIGEFFRHQPPWFYIPHLLAKFFPWSFFLPLGLWQAFRRESGENKKELMFLLTWFVVVFIFFSASFVKHSRYLLPLYPAASLLVAGAWSKVPSNRLYLSAWLLLGLLFFTALALPAYARLKVPEHFAPSLFAALLLFCVGLIILGFVRLKRPGGIFAVIFSATALVLTLYSIYLVPHVDAVKSTRSFAAQLTSVVSPQDDLRAYRLLKPGLFFYSRRYIPLLVNEQELLNLKGSDKRVYVLMYDKEYKRMSAHPGFPFQFVFRGTIDDHKRVVLVKGGK